MIAPARFMSSTAAMNTLHDLRIGRVALVGLAQHADARPFKPSRHERRAVVRDRRGMSAWAEVAGGRLPRDA